MRGAAITAAAVARQARVDDRAIAGDLAGWLTATEPLCYRDRRGRPKIAGEPHAARLHVLAVTEGMLDLHAA